MRSIKIETENMVSDKTAFDVGYWGPRGGVCCVCGKSLGAYWTKWINLQDGRVMCGSTDTHMGQNLEGFHEWSDG